MSDPTTPVREPRNVIAGIVGETVISSDTEGRLVTIDLGYKVMRHKADTIITALRDAGYEIVRAAQSDAPVVDRLRAAIEKYGTPEHDNRVTLNLDDLSRIAHRAGIGEPDAPEITGAMIRSGLIAHIRSLRNSPEGQVIVRGVRPPKDEDDEPGGMHYEAMRAALTAALNARG